MDEPKTQTFAEWLTDFVVTHSGISIAISQGVYGCLEVSIYKETSFGLKKKIGYLSTIDVYTQAECDLDDELIDICKILTKELDDYGK